MRAKVLVPSGTSKHEQALGFVEEKLRSERTEKQQKRNLLLSWPAKTVQRNRRLFSMNGADG
jgi:hypothetical protein